MLYLNQHCPLFTVLDLHQEFSSLKVRFAGGVGTGNSSLCGTGLLADGKSGNFTVCLDWEMICVLQSGTPLEVQCSSSRDCC